MKYEKPAIPISEQIEKLRGCDLIIIDPVFAAHHLAHIGYYRLAGYWWPMQADHRKQSLTV